jgi:hypothetical protein
MGGHSPDIFDAFVTVAGFPKISFSVISPPTMSKKILAVDDSLALRMFFS